MAVPKRRKSVDDGGQSFDTSRSVVSDKDEISGGFGTPRSSAEDDADRQFDERQHKYRAHAARGDFPVLLARSLRNAQDKPVDEEGRDPPGIVRGDLSDNGVQYK